MIACVVRGGEELQEAIEDERSLRWGVVFLCADKSVYEYQSEDTVHLLGSADDLCSFGDRCLDML